MSIQQLASASGALRLGNILPQARTIGSGDIAVRSCCSQWNECQSDDIYVAIVGPEFDGHDFARDAVQRGASAVVTERLLAIDLPQFIVGDSRLAFGQICHALAGQPSQRLQTTGVSGSNGKTVTSHLIQQIFLAAGADVGLLSTISTATENESKADFSAPGLADRLSTMVLEDCSHAVVEIPSEALAQHTLAGTKLDTAVLTNIHYDDLGFHRTKENYRRANLRLLDYLKPTGVAVLNADDPASHFLLGEIDAPVLTVAMKQQAELTARIVERQAAWQTFLLTAGGQSVAVRTNIIGDQHVYNCLSAAAVGLSNGIELPVIARGLENASTVPGRLERVDCGQPFNVWIDSAKSVRQLATALQSIRKVTKGKVWCV
ncbi:MAG: Mur ligase family protein [Planctomycetota bacterium]